MKGEKEEEEESRSEGGGWRRYRGVGDRQAKRGGWGGRWKEEGNR